MAPDETGQANPANASKAQGTDPSREGAVSNSAPGSDPNLIRVFDNFGRELFITKEQWRTKVLPGTLKSNWNNPDQLYSIIVGSLNDGFIADVLPAAQQLSKIDPSSPRSACVYAIVQMKMDRLDEAEAILRTYLQEHGDDGSVLTNLAKTFAARGESQKAFDTLWHALEIDPNQDNGLLWFASLCREQSGGSGWSEALARVAALPRSWRSQIWLAREALKAQNLETALRYYNDALQRIGDPVPPDVLMQIGGDLGQAGHLRQSIQLTEPLFKPEIHGLAVGNNLIKAHFDLGELAAARKLLDQLYSLKRPDYQQTLSFWDTEIAKASIAQSASPTASQLQISMASIAGPVWLKPASEGTELFGEKPSNAPVIAFLGSTVEQATETREIQRQIADTQGRLSRALPLFLAEQIWFRTCADVKTLVPFITSEPRGFVLSAKPWRDQDAAKYSQQNGEKCLFVVVSHISCINDPWTTELRVIRSDDDALVGRITKSFDPQSPEDAFKELAEQLVSLLASVSIPAENRRLSEVYSVPDRRHFPFYLLRLEQLLAVRMATMGGTDANFLHGERDILEGNLRLCIDCPDNVATRIVFAKTLLAMKRIRPDLMQEFKDKVLLLNQEKPLSKSAQVVLDRMFSDAFAT